MQRVAGGILIFLAVSIATWVIYVKFIAPTPDTPQRFPFMPLGICSAMLYVGIKWIVAKKAN